MLTGVKQSSIAWECWSPTALPRQAWCVGQWVGELHFPLSQGWTSRSGPLAHVTPQHAELLAWSTAAGDGECYFYVLPVVTARMLVWKARSCGSAHAEVFLCQRNVWVLLPPHSWSADGHGWQNTVPACGVKALSRVWLPCFCQDLGLQHLLRAQLAALAESIPVSQPGLGGQLQAGLAGEGHFCILSQKNDPGPARAVTGKPWHKALAQAPASLCQRREGRTDFWEAFAVASEHSLHSELRTGGLWLVMDSVPVTQTAGCRPAETSARSRAQECCGAALHGLGGTRVCRAAEAGLCESSVQGSERAQTCGALSCRTGRLSSVPQRTTGLLLGCRSLCGPCGKRRWEGWWGVQGWHD